MIAQKGTEVASLHQGTGGEGPWKQIIKIVRVLQAAMMSLGSHIALGTTYLFFIAGRGGLQNEIFLLVGNEP